MPLTFLNLGVYALMALMCLLFSLLLKPRSSPSNTRLSLSLTSLYPLRLKGFIYHPERFHNFGKHMFRNYIPISHTMFFVLHLFCKNKQNTYNYIPMAAKSTFSTRVGSSTYNKLHNKSTYTPLQCRVKSHSCVN